MTQFQPPPLPPGDLPGEGYGHQEPLSPAPMSAAAVAGFVCSLLGCVGVTALLGFVFGLIGLAKTRDGVRRGRGLAIAAIPISLVTGAGSVVIAIAGYWFIGLAASTARITVALPKVLAADSALFAGAESALRPLCSASFNEDVSSEAIQAWLTQIASTHGKLKEAPAFSGQEPTTSANHIAWQLSAQFDKGPATIVLRLVNVGAGFRLDDIEIADLSPRQP